MVYFKAKWKHSFDNEPVWFYSELDDARWELRKVEVYQDGRKNFASAHEKIGTDLSEKPIPPSAEIASQPEFEVYDTSKEEFERVWGERFSSGRTG